MDRRTTKNSTSTSTTSGWPPPLKELEAFRRNLSKHVADAGGNDSAARPAFERALADADDALQFEYIRYGHPRAPDPRLDAYHNVQQVLAHMQKAQRAPDYLVHDEDDAIYVAELGRLAMLVRRVLAERLD